MVFGVVGMLPRTRTEQTVVILMTEQLENGTLNQVDGAGDGLVAAFSAHQDFRD